MHFTDDKIEQQRVKICPKVSGAEPRGKIKLDENPGKLSKARSSGTLKSIQDTALGIE